MPTFTTSPTTALKSAEEGSAIYLQLHDRCTSFNKAMGAITATCCKLNIKVKQQALKAVSIDVNMNTCVRLVKIQILEIKN